MMAYLNQNNNQNNEARILQIGTLDAPGKPFINDNDKFYGTICFKEPYSKFSQEELRYIDYKVNAQERMKKKGQNPTTIQNTNSFFGIQGKENAINNSFSQSQNQNFIGQNQSQMSNHSFGSQICVESSQATPYNALNGNIPNNNNVYSNPNGGNNMFVQMNNGQQFTFGGGNMNNNSNESTSLNLNTYSNNSNMINNQMNFRNNQFQFKQEQNANMNNIFSGNANQSGYNNNFCQQNFQSNANAQNSSFSIFGKPQQNNQYYTQNVQNQSQNSNNVNPFVQVCNNNINTNLNSNSNNNINNNNNFQSFNNFNNNNNFLKQNNNQTYFNLNENKNINLNFLSQPTAYPFPQFPLTKQNQNSLPNTIQFSPTNINNSLPISASTNNSHILPQQFSPSYIAIPNTSNDLNQNLPLSYQQLQRKIESYANPLISLIIQLPNLNIGAHYDFIFMGIDKELQEYNFMLEQEESEYNIYDSSNKNQLWRGFEYTNFSYISGKPIRFLPDSYYIQNQKFAFLSNIKESKFQTPSQIRESQIILKDIKSLENITQKSKENERCSQVSKENKCQFDGDVKSYNGENKENSISEHSINLINIINNEDPSKQQNMSKSEKEEEKKLEISNKSSFISINKIIFNPPNEDGNENIKIHSLLHKLSYFISNEVTINDIPSHFTIKKLKGEIIKKIISNFPFSPNELQSKMLLNDNSILNDESLVKSLDISKLLEISFNSTLLPCYPIIVKYLSNPPIKDLEKMSFIQLSQLPKLEIYNEYGKVTFINQIDCTYVNFDTLFDINRYAIKFNQTIQKDIKNKVNSQLEIELYQFNLLHLNTKKEQDTFLIKLKQLITQNNGELISSNMNNGIITFRTIKNPF